MVVMKFGGSSVANAERIKHVASIVKSYADRKPIVVLSAMGDTTDHLLEAADMAVKGEVAMSRIEALHKETADILGVDFAPIQELLEELDTLLTGISLLKELTKRTRDYLVSFGERLSVRLAAAYLNKTGTPARFYDAWDVGFVTDSNFMAAELLEETWTLIPQALGGYKSGKDNAIPVVTGFIAKDKKGYITTLGRGGSDLTATMLGAALGAEEVQTWKDVNGILTADPRIVPSARTVPEVTYEEAAELAYFGAQVLHPRSMVPCRKTGTPVRVKNSYNIESEGSIIVNEHTTAVGPVRAITAVKDVTLLDIVSTRMIGASGFMAHIFNQFLKWDISIDVIATSEVSISLTVNNKGDLSGLLSDMQGLATTECKQNKAIVTVICDADKATSILADGFAALVKKDINVEMISKGASKVNISMICDDDEADLVVRTLHDAYFPA